MYRRFSHISLIALKANSFVHPNINGKIAMCQDIPTNYTEPTRNHLLESQRNREELLKKIQKQLVRRISTQP